MTRTSRMAAITNPSRYGYTRVLVFFGEVRVQEYQEVVVRGDLLRRDSDGKVFEFQAVQSGVLELTEIDLADEVTEPGLEIA